MCIDNSLTVCNLITGVDYFPLSWGSKTHVTPCYYNDAVSIYSPHIVWEDVLTLISQLIPSHSTTMSTTFHDSEGCCTFQSCITLSHRYAASAAIDDAAHYGARSLAEGLGLDYSLIDNQVAQVHSSSMLAFMHTLSSACMGSTLQPRHMMVISPPPRIRSLPVQPLCRLLFSPTIEVVSAIALHRSVIAPTTTHAIPLPPPIHSST